MGTIHRNGIAYGGTVKPQSKDFGIGYYSTKTKKSDYLYELEYDNIDYNYAYKHFSSDEDITLGGCSSFRIGNFFARNYDWTYDETVEFLVHTPKTKTRYGVVGVAAGIKQLNKEFVATHSESELYKLVPFMLTDGINTEGLAVAMNVVPTDYGKNKAVPTGDIEEEVCAIMLPRYILDRFSKATDAANYVKEHISIYFTNSLHDKNYELHYLISDKLGNNVILEIKDNKVVLVDGSAITNFHLTGVEFNADGKVYTPATQTSTENAYDTNKVTLHGSGLERFNIIKSATGETKTVVKQLLKDLYFTKAYTGKTWYTEFTGGDLTVKSATTDFASVISEAVQNYEERSREVPKTWQSVHSSIYDFESMTLELNIQEDSTTTYSADYSSSSSVEVIDSLESVSTTSALSANQGRVLKEQIDDLSQFKVVTGHITSGEAYESHNELENSSMYVFEIAANNKTESPIPVGSTVNVATVTGIDMDKVKAIPVASYTGSTGIFPAVNPDGSVIIRVIGSEWPVNFECMFRIFLLKM